jgi:hypothetical protein
MSNLVNGDYIKLQRFITKEGVQYYYIDGQNKFAKFPTGNLVDVLPELHETSNAVFDISNTIDYIPAPSPLWKKNVRDFYLIDNNLNVNNTLLDTWNSYDLVSYLAEARLAQTEYGENLANFLTTLIRAKATINETETSISNLRNAFIAAGSSQDLIDTMFDNQQACKNAGNMLDILIASVTSFRNDVVAV